MLDKYGRAQVVWAVSCGRLSARLPKTVSGRMGSGLPCSLCGKSIDADQVEAEYEDQGRSYRLHLQCMTAWEAVTMGGGPATDEPCRYLSTAAAVPPVTRSPEIELER